MRVARLMAVVLVCALAVLAGEPWDDKEPKAWTAKDVDKILNRSPWAKRVATARTALQNTTDTGDFRGTKASDRILGQTREDDWVIAWWWSSKTVRRAYLRMHELSGGQVDAQQAQEFAESDMTTPAVSIMGGGNMIAVSGKLPVDRLKQMAWLESKRFKEEIYPQEVRILDDGAGKVDRIVFIFPEKVGDVPVVNAEDKRILFRWKLPKNPAQAQKPETAEQFEASFEPNKMTINKSADF